MALETESRESCRDHVVLLRQITKMMSNQQLHALHAFTLRFTSKHGRDQKYIIPRSKAIVCTTSRTKDQDNSFGTCQYWSRVHATMLCKTKKTWEVKINNACKWLQLLCTLHIPRISPSIIDTAVPSERLYWTLWTHRWCVQVYLQDLFQAQWLYKLSTFIKRTWQPRVAYIPTTYKSMWHRFTTSPKG